jgi:hypothetical protein
MGEVDHCQLYACGAQGHLYSVWIRIWLRELEAFQTFNKYTNELGFMDNADLGTIFLCCWI